ncbi:hypothetical protein AX16_002095 [Volvariella volvacea WC 439]|nr:hypothetical protein AX16_002095 [Volvariella volvacea WC 439]
MPKRKVAQDSEEEFEEESTQSSEEEEASSTPPPKSKSVKKAKEKAKPTPTTKKPKVAPLKEESEDESPRGGNAGITVKKGPEGEKYVELANKRRVTVRKFKGSTYVDIREFYGSDGKENPGKRGISLTLEQWNTLKKATSAIDQLCAALK